jgi:uncharacterized membrane protein
MLMTCSPEVLRSIPLFSLLDDEEAAVLAAQVEFKSFQPRERIYKTGDTRGQAYVMISGKVRVTAVDDDEQEVIVDEPGEGEFFGFASMIEQIPHHTTATALEETSCLEVSRDDIAHLLQNKPHAGMDLLAILARQLHAAQALIRTRVTRNPNDLIEAEETRGERLADDVARFGGSWTFIMAFGVVMVVYTGVNIALRGRAWDPYPFILLNLFLSMLAAIQAPVIMMSQNRQDSKDRLRGELDFDVNRRAASDIQGLARKLNLLDDKIDDVASLLRGREAR